MRSAFLPVLAIVCCGLLLGLLIRGVQRTPGEGALASAQAGPASVLLPVPQNPPDATPLASAERQSPGAPGTVSGRPAPQPQSNPPPADPNVAAIVDGVPIGLDAFEAALTIDQAVGVLLGTPMASDPLATLEQLINGELILQAAQRDGFAIDDAAATQALTELLASAGRAEADLARTLADAGIGQDAFRQRLQALARIDRFSRQQAQREQIPVADYVQRLQKTARISIGPAAAAVQVPPPEATQSTNTGESPAELSDGTLGREGSQAQPTATVAAGATSAAPPAPIGTGVGAMAPPFSLPILGAAAGDRLTLEQLRGRPAVLSFWTTWCPYCQRQTPVLAAAFRADTAGSVQFVGIDVKETPDVVSSYVDSQGVPYPVVLDEGGQVADQYGILGFPTTFFLDEHGRILAQHVGALSADELNAYLAQAK